MNIFLRILNKIRFGEVETIGHDDIHNITYQKGYSRRPYRVAPGYSLLKNGKVLQKNVIDTISIFEAPDAAKKILNKERFATLDTDKKYTVYASDGTKIFVMGDESKAYGSASFLSEDQKVVQVENKMLNGIYFVVNADPNTKFITEEYASVEVLQNGRRKVTTLNKNRYGQQATYYLDKNFLPCSVKFVDKNDEQQENEKAVELYQEIDFSPKFKPSFVVCDQNMQVLSNQYEKIEKVFGHWLATDKNGEQRFIDKNGRNRSYPIDKIIDLGNGQLLIKRNHSVNWDIQRQDSLKFVVKGIKRAVHNSDTGLTFGFYNNTPVLFGYDPSEMHTVDSETARLVLNLLNKTRMGSKFIDKVQANPEAMDKTLETFKTVLSKNLEQNPNSKVIKRLVGTSSKSLDRRFINHLIGVYKAREKRDNKTISEIESQISSLENQISTLNNRLRVYRDKRGVASETYYSTLESKERLERKLSVLQTGLTTHISLLSEKSEDEEIAEYAGIQCLTPETMTEMRNASPAIEAPETFTEKTETEEEVLISKYAGSQPQTIEKGDEE